MSFRFHLIMVIKFYLVLDLKGFAPFLSSSRSINISAIFYLFLRTFLIINLIKSNSAAPTKPANIASLNISLSPPYCYKSYLSYLKQNPKWKELMFSLERRWSSRTFRYGYLVTTSPQSLTLPSTAASKWLAHRLRVLPTPMVWRAVCTRPGNAFTAAFWSAITSNSGFMISSCRDQSELGSVFWGLLDIAI